MPYIPLELEPTVRVRRLYSLHYFQFASGYVFPGERHNFWEMVYLDKGEADIGAGRRTVRLTQGQVIFHKPNEFHSIWANYASAPNIMVLTFASASPAMRAFRSLHTTLDTPMRRLLQQIIDEGIRCFGPTLDLQDRLVPLDSAPPGGVQLIGSYLEQFLILLLRSLDAQPAQRAATPLTQEHAAIGQIDRVTELMRAHPDGSLSFEDIRQAAGVGQTVLKQLFRHHTGQGVMAYYQQLRLEEARRLLRTGEMNITQTAEALGYSSIHAFSRQFTAHVGMTPSAYLRSVRS